MIRAARLAAALLVACLGVVVTVGAPANAVDCTCKQGTLERLTERADVVFIGEVDAVETSGNDYTYDVTASRAYKGEPERETQLFSAGGPDNCGLGELRVDTSYIFLATGEAAPYDTDSCSGTTLRNDTKVQKIERILGEGTAIEPPPPPQAVLTKVEDAPPAGFARMAAPGAAAAIIGVLGLVVVRRLGRR